MSQHSHEHPEEYTHRPYRGYDPDEYGWKQDSRAEEEDEALRAVIAAAERRYQRRHKVAKLLVLLVYCFLIGLVVWLVLYPK